MRAQAKALDRQHLQPQLALLWPNLRATVDVDTLAGGEIQSKRVEAPTRQRRLHARIAADVLEREEDRLPPVLAAQLADLPLDPHGRQPAQPVGEAAVEGGDGEDLAVAVLDRLDLRHAEIVRSRGARHAFHVKRERVPILRQRVTP